MSTDDAKAEIPLDEGIAHIKRVGMQKLFGLIDTNAKISLGKEFADLYELVFKLAKKSDDNSKKVYEAFRAEFSDYLTNSVAASMEKIKAANFETDFLREWDKRWSNQKLLIKGFSNMFMYLDRFFTENKPDFPPIKDQGYKLYKSLIFDRYCDFASTCVINAIQRERESEEQDRHLLSQAAQVFVEMGYNFGEANRDKLGLYKDKLSKNIVDQASAFYQRVSRTWLEQDSCPVYLRKAQDSLEQERKRTDAYLHATTMEPLQKACYKELLQFHQREILAKSTGIVQMLELNSAEDLSRLYAMYNQSAEDLAPIAESVQHHIKKEGEAVVESNSKPAPQAQNPEGKEQENKGADGHTFVKKLIDLHHRYAQVVRDCFGNNQIFQKCLKSAFEAFINMDNRVSKLLAKYVNDVLEKFTKVRPQDVEGTLDNIVFIYGYLTEKDVFERDYQMFLAQRLLLGLCESEYSEKSMIGKLKTQAGYQWTNKLEGMFKDVQKSKELLVKFQKFYDTVKNHNLVLEVNVCTTGCWPSSKLIQCPLPEDLETPCEKYKRYYLQQHSGHKLVWRMDQGQAEVLVNFPKGAKVLVVSTYQMLILLAFNTKDILTYQQILESTGIPAYDIVNHLLSLAHPKVGILDKNPKTKDLAEDHKFRLNPAYTNTLRKVQVKLLVTVENNQQKAEEEEAIELQRRHQIDAAIVRIMKTRKTLPHTRLLTEVIQQLQARFKPKTNLIKKRVEALIEQEYLKRDEEDRSTYHYLA